MHKYRAEYVLGMNEDGTGVDDQWKKGFREEPTYYFEAENVEQAKGIAAVKFPSTKGRIQIMAEGVWYEGFTEWSWLLMADDFDDQGEEHSNVWWIMLDRDPIPLKYRLRILYHKALWKVMFPFYWTRSLIKYGRPNRFMKW